MKKYIPHVLVLSLLSIAEAARLFEFYNTFTGNEIAGMASAGISVAIIFYLAFYRYKWASRWATLLCIILSLASFVSPLQKELKKNEAANEIEKLKEYPKYDRRQAWTGKETYDTIIQKETHRIDVENENIMLRNSEIRAERKFSLYFWHLVLGAIVLGICVPILNYLVSHKIANLSTPISNHGMPNFWDREESGSISIKKGQSVPATETISESLTSEEIVPVKEDNIPKRQTIHIASKKRKFYDEGPSLPFPFMEGMSLA
jgi:hypothetical protein